MKILEKLHHISYKINVEMILLVKFKFKPTKDKHVNTENVLPNDDYIAAIKSQILTLSPTAYPILWLLRGGASEPPPPKISRKESSVTPCCYIAFVSLYI